MTTIAANLTRLMEEQGLRATDLAVECGVSRATVSRWTSGASTPRNKALARLSESLKCKPSELTAMPEKPPSDLGQRLYSVPEAARLLGLSVPATWDLLRSGEAKPWGVAWKKPDGRWKSLVFARPLNDLLGIQ